MPNVVHGYHSSPTHKTWQQMKVRCLNPKHSAYASYGGRGITICDRWTENGSAGFLNFLADMGERPDGMTLDRRDNDRGYEPGNVRWATWKQQASNRRNSKTTPYLANLARWLANVCEYPRVMIAELIGVCPSRVTKICGRRIRR